MAEFNYYEELKASLEEAVAFKRGDKTRCRVSVRELPVPEYSAGDVARVRSELQLSQRGFAGVLGVSPRTVEAWEAGRNAPGGTARHLLYLIEQDNSLADKFVAR